MIPSPPFSSISFGLFSIQIYGITMALAITSGALFVYKHKDRAELTDKQFENLIFLPILFSIIGARTYYVLTNYQLFIDNPLQIFAIWNGGIGILGGFTGGVIALYYFSKHYHKSVIQLTDLLAPAIALGQSIGRFGNYFNQELYGFPTKLPWSLYVDPQHRLLGFAKYSTYHPTFLYEIILNFCNFLILFKLFRKQVKPKILTATYLINYGLIRIFLEYFRMNNDTNAEYFSIKVAQYLGFIMIIIGIYLITTIKKQEDISI